jgi:hypothetical protein
MVSCPQNLGLKGLTGKIFQNKELVDRLDGRTFFRECVEGRGGSVFVSEPESIVEGIRAISFFRISVRKILNSWKLLVDDPLLRPQNLGSKGLTGKIFQNKELAAES